MQILFQNRKLQTSLLLTLFALSFCLRCPNALIEGRFWAEEGCTFFHNAATLPPLKALFTSFGGYLNITTNAATLIAYWSVPLRYAPYVTTFIGLLFQLCPLFLLLTAKDPWLDTFKVRILATLVLLLIPPSSELSLQSLHIQFQLALSCAIIAALETQNNYQRWFRLCILFLAPLSGLLVISLLPVFGLRVIIDKTWLRFEQFLILAFGSFLQYCFFYVHLDARGYEFSFINLLTILFSRNILIPFIGLHHFSDHITKILYDARLHENIPYFACIIPVIILAFAIYLIIKYPKTRFVIWFIISGLILLSTCVYGVLGNSINMITAYAGERYIFCSQALFGLAILYFSVQLPFPKQRKITNVILGWLLIIGVFNFSHPQDNTTQGHNWSQEVTSWERDHHHVLKVWPSGWLMILP